MARPDAPLLPLCVSLAAVFFLLARLSRWEFRTGTFWHLVLPPWLLLGSAQGLFLLVETTPQRFALAAVVSLLTLFFTEQSFAYVHAPALYRPYAIQHLSLGLNILTVFFLSAFAFGTRLFLQAPFHVVAPAVFLCTAYVVYQTLWVSKMEPPRAFACGIVGGLLLTELFVALTFLPTGMYAGAAVLAAAAYLFLGLVRARFLHQLTRVLAWRYGVAACVLSLAVFATAQWR